MSTKPQDDNAKPKQKPVSRFSFLQSVRNNFLTGIVVVAPFGITIYLTWTIVDYVDRQVLPQVLPLIPDQYQPQNLLPFSLPGLGLLIFILFLIFIGSFTKNFFGRELLRIGERWVERMPVVRSIYNALKQIAETVFTQSSKSFEHACLVEYPRKGVWAIAFVSTATKGEVPKKAVDGRAMMSVFLPTTPNPTSGFLLFVPKEDVVLLDMTIEEAAKLVISAGLVSPPTADDMIVDAAARPEQPSDDPTPPLDEAAPARGYSSRLRRQRLTDTSSQATQASETATPATAGEAAARDPLRGA